MFVFTAVRASNQHSFKAIASLQFVVLSNLRSARAHVFVRASCGTTHCIQIDFFLQF